MGQTLSSTGLRVRAAHPADVPRLAELIKGYAERGLMLPRVPEQLARHFREFVVVTDAEETILGCAALRIYTAQLAEVVARSLGVGTLFALTLRDSFFHRLGFRTVPKELFPLEVWADCRTCPSADACMEIAVVREVEL